MMKSESCTTALSQLLGLADEIINRAPAQDRLPRLADTDALIRHLATQRVEGGNPVGPESTMLVAVLGHIEKCRMGFETVRLAKWRTIADALLPMVRDNLADAMSPIGPPKITTTETGRFG